MFHPEIVIRNCRFFKNAYGKGVILNSIISDSELADPNGNALLIFLVVRTIITDSEWITYDGEQFTYAEKISYRGKSRFMALALVEDNVAVICRNLIENCDEL